MAVTCSTWYERRETFSWPTASGKMISADVSAQEVHCWSTPGKIVYPLSLKYEYAVEGMNYAGNRLQLITEPFQVQEDAFDKAREYSAGKMVDVYYNPKEPGSAVLEPGGKNMQNDHLLFWFGVLCFGAAYWKWVNESGQQPVPPADGGVI